MEAIDAAAKAREEERALMTSQVKTGQQLTWGASKALEGTKDVQGKAALRLLDSANIALASAVGKLDKQSQEEILTIVELLVKQRTAEAEKQLAVIDAKLDIVTKERDELKSTIPILDKQVKEVSKEVFTVKKYLQ